MRTVHPSRILGLLMLVATVCRADPRPVAPAPGLGANSRLGINLAGPADWGTEYPFVDVFRQARAWVSQKPDGRWGEGPALDLDERGWVRRLEPGCWAETPLCTHGHCPSGEYVCLYDGEGDLEFANHRRTVTNAPGRIVIDVDGSRDSGIFLRIRRTNPDNPVRNIRVIMPGFEATCAAQPFHPLFLERWGAFNTLRFMDWMLTNGSSVREWNDRPKTNDATWTVRGIPVETMVDLCNRLGANPWFCMPHLATDDYVRNFARTVRASLRPDLRVYVERSNEVWNNGFEQTHHARKVAVEQGIGPQERPWEGGAQYHARRSVEIFRIWEEVFGGTNRLVRVLAWQAAAGAYWTDGMLLAQGDTARHVDALAIAPYITACIPAQEAAAVAALSVEQILDRAEQEALPQSIGWIRTQRAVADKYRLQLVAYEAGQHLVGVGGGQDNDELTARFIAANRHPRMGPLYAKYLDAWRDAGGDLMCLFSSTGSYSKWGSWGLLEYASQPPATAPKYQAVVEWNARNQRPATAAPPPAAAGVLPPLAPAGQP